MKIFYSKYADNNFMLKSDSSKTSEEERESAILQGPPWGPPNKERRRLNRLGWITDGSKLTLMNLMVDIKAKGRKSGI